MVLMIILSVFTFSCTDNEDEYPKFDVTIDLEQNIDRFIQKYVDQDSPGISLLVKKGGTVVLKKSYGLANIEEGLPITSDTPFYLASVSKQFTAMAIMILQESGKLNYNDPISDYIPEVPQEWSEITIHHLLTHRSGIPDYLNDLEWYRSGITNREVIEDLVKIIELEFEPGTKHDYSNSGYLLLTEICSRLESSPFHEFMEENIFDSLGMSRTLVYDESKPKNSGRAIGYRSDGELRDYDLLTTGDGGMFSTINDLEKWDQSFYDDLLISAETKRLAYTSYESDNYGYGWGIRKMEDYEHYAHGGGLAGYRTLISRIPSKEFTVIILSNGSYDWIYQLRNEIVRVYL